MKREKLIDRAGITFWLDATLKNRLIDIAIKRDLNISQLLRRIITKYLKEAEHV